MEDSLQIDSLDKKIIQLITKNARIPYLEVARECNVSGAAIHQRIQKLTNLGVITGSKFTIEPKMIGFKTCAYMGIFLDKASLYNDVLEELRKIPEITQCHFTTGNYSVFIKIYIMPGAFFRHNISSLVWCNRFFNYQGGVFFIKSTQFPR